MADAVLALDQGTTSSKALLVDPVTLRVLGSASRPVAISTPRPGWVEQDAAELWESVRAAGAQVIADHPELELVAIAVSDQRESVTAWDGATGIPLAPLLSWQDQRGVPFCDALATPDTVRLVGERTGLELTAMYSAAKLRWLVDLVGDRPGVRYGTVDTWLIDRLTGSAVYAIEAGNASRTLLFDLATLAWDADLCDLFGVPIAALPEIRPSDGPWAVTAGVEGIPDGIPILAVLADSHAALYGHWLLAPEHGEAGKATYGTGSSIMAPAASAGSRCEGVSTTLAWQIGAPQYAYEANILYSGAGLDWFGRMLGVDGGRGLSALAAGTDDSGGAVFVPALNGLGAPWWEPNALGTLTGLSVSTRRAQVARAGLEAIAHQVCDTVDVMDPDRRLTLLHAGGGASASDLLMQIQANLLGRELLVASVGDISPLGAAALAARRLGTELRIGLDAGRLVAPETHFTDERRDVERARWRDALVRAGVSRAAASRTPTTEGNPT